MKKADLTIDLMLLRHSPEQGVFVESGTRMPLVVEPSEILTRMMPTADDMRRVRAASRALSNAKEMTVTSSTGTDFFCRVGDFPNLEAYGFADEPGRWDH